MVSSGLAGRRILVTGGAGLIGSHLVDSLLPLAREVRILDNLEPQSHPFGEPAWIPCEARFIRGDIRDHAALLEALRGVEIVFHQAAFGGFTTAVGKYLDVNATGTARIFEVIRKHRLSVERIVGASSQAVYGESTHRCPEHGRFHPTLRSIVQLESSIWDVLCSRCGHPASPEPNPEDRRLMGETPYGVSKLAQEGLMIGLGRQFGIPTIALRYAVTYGPRQSVFNPYTGVVSIFSTLLLNDKSPVVYEDGKQTRDFLYVSDNVAGNLIAATHPDMEYGVYNLGTGEPVEIGELARRLAVAFGLPISPVLRGSYRPGDARHFVHDPTKIRELGFRPRIGLEEGLQRYAQWIQSLGNVKEYFSEAERTLGEAQVVRMPKA